MLATLIPLFDETLAVSGYSLFAQKKNNLLNPSLLGTGGNDGAGVVVGLEIINAIGSDAISRGNTIFVPLNNMSIFSDIEEQCKISHKSVALLFDNSIKPEMMFINRIKELKAAGFTLAIRKLDISDFEPYRDILSLMDFIILDYKKIANIDAAKIYFGKVYPNIRLVAGNLDNMDAYEDLVETGGYSLFEGEFYRLPVTKGDTEVSPLKANYIELLNVVNKPDFDLTTAADVIGRDTALVIDLLKMVNRIAINSEITSIRHAAAMLGQRELKKWINTAVANKLCADRPNEITRLSLIRAKFCENLAKVFEMADKDNELFLIGLFSLIDLILNMKMEDALKLVYLPKEIQTALTSGEGRIAMVLDFVKAYEQANWAEASRILLIENIETNAVFDAYVDALDWYSKLFSK
ncbi:MAG: HDOD domain-containing protein [Lachnospiraceae bacterium]|nr:HDOD domain-containing protein [Lachnospiraceae bacterium]